MLQFNPRTEPVLQSGQKYPVSPRPLPPRIFLFPFWLCLFFRFPLSTFLGFSFFFFPLFLFSLLSLFPCPCLTAILDSTGQFAMTKTPLTTGASISVHAILVFTIVSLHRDIVQISVWCLRF